MAVKNIVTTLVICVCLFVFSTWMNTNTRFALPTPAATQFVQQVTLSQEETKVWSTDLPKKFEPDRPPRKVNLALEVGDLDMRNLSFCASCSIVPVAASALRLSPHFTVTPDEANAQLPSLGIVVSRGEERLQPLLAAFDDVFFMREGEQNYLRPCRDTRAVLACAAGVLRDKGALFRDVTIVDHSEAGLRALKELQANTTDARIRIVMSGIGKKADGQAICNYARGMEMARYFGPPRVFGEWMSNFCVEHSLQVYAPLAVRIPLHAFPILMTVGNALFAEWADWRVGLVETLDLFNLYDGEASGTQVSVWQSVINETLLSPTFILPRKAGRIIDRVPPVPDVVRNKNGQKIPSPAAWYETFSAGYSRERASRRAREVRRRTEGTGMLALVRLNAADQVTRPSSSHYFDALRKAFHTLVVVAPFEIRLKEAIMTNIFCTHPRQQHTMAICASYVMRTQLAQAADGIIYLHFDAYIVPSAFFNKDSPHNPGAIWHARPGPSVTPDKASKLSSWMWWETVMEPGMWLVEPLNPVHSRCAQTFARFFTPFVRGFERGNANSKITADEVFTYESILERRASFSDTSFAPAAILDAFVHVAHVLEGFVPPSEMAFPLIYTYASQLVQDVPFDDPHCSGSCCVGLDVGDMRAPCGHQVDMLVKYRVDKMVEFLANSMSCNEAQEVVVLPSLTAPKVVWTLCKLQLTSNGDVQDGVAHVAVKHAANVDWTGSSRGNGKVILYCPALSRLHFAHKSEESTSLSLLRMRSRPHHLRLTVNGSSSQFAFETSFEAERCLHATLDLHFSFGMGLVDALIEVSATEIAVTLSQGSSNKPPHGIVSCPIPNRNNLK